MRRASGGLMEAPFVGSVGVYVVLTSSTLGIYQQ